MHDKFFFFGFLKKLVFQYPGSLDSRIQACTKMQKIAFFYMQSFLGQYRTSLLTLVNLSKAERETERGNEKLCERESVCV